MNILAAISKRVKSYDFLGIRRDFFVATTAVASSLGWAVLDFSHFDRYLKIFCAAKIWWSFLDSSVVCQPTIQPV